MIFTTPLALLLLLLIPLFVYLGWPRFAYRRRRDAASLLLRLLIVSLLVLGLAGTQVSRAADRLARDRYQRGVEGLLKVLETERRLLSDVSRLADFVVDSSELNIHQLRETVVAFVAWSARPTVVNMISFCFRYGAPSAAELFFDVRFLPNLRR